MKRYLAILLTVLLGLSLMGCSSALNNSNTAADDVESQDNVKEEDAQEDNEAKSQESSQEERTIVLVAKTEGFAWFDATRSGIEAFGKDNGVNTYQIAPENGDVAAQVQLCEELIAQKVDAICIIPNDTKSMIPVIEKARAAGITVVTHEAPDIAEYVDFDMESFANYDIGTWMLNNMVEATGGEGKWAMMVQTLGTTAHMEYYDSIKEQIGEYPGLEEVVTEPIEDNNDDATAYDRTIELLKAHPDLKVICSATASSTGVARALQEKNRDDIMLISGIAPSASKEYIETGWYYAAYTWDPFGAAYVSGDIALKLLNGETIDSATSFPYEGYETVTVENGIIRADALLEVTKDNVASLPW